MKCRAGVAVGVVGGYFLGRSKKIKLALILGSVGAGLRLGKPGQPLRTGPAALGSDDTSPAEGLPDEFSKNELSDEPRPNDRGDESALGGRPADIAPQMRVDGVHDGDGSDVPETVIFSLDGRQYRLDLSIEDATKLRDSLAPFIAVARPKRAKSQGQRGRNGGRGSQQLRRLGRSHGSPAPG